MNARYYRRSPGLLLNAVNLFRIEYHELLTPFNAHECRLQLDEDLRPPAFDERSFWSKVVGVSHPLDGMVTDTGFDLHKTYRAHNNGSWARVQGTFEETAEGTRIHVHVGPSPNLRSTSLIVYGLLSFIEMLILYGILFRSTSANGVHFRVQNPFMLLGLLPFAAFMLFMSAGSAASIRGEAHFVLKRLCERLEAHPL